MSSKRINVLIYAGPGATINSVRHATYTLRRLLGPNYAIISVSAEQILKEPWTASCALLVMPGGADLNYCRMLNGEGNRKIKQYVQMGGAYLGLCAGGYYGCSRCEFEEGKKGMEVVGDRELAFFPGTCRGLAFPGFVYASEAGTRAVGVKVNPDSFAGDKVNDFKTYYNGGGVFVDAAKFKDRGVETLATYTDNLAVDSGEGGAAIVLCKVGEGKVVLTGPHPEFAPINLERNQPSNADFGKVVDALVADETPRTAFLRAVLKKLGLEVSQEASAVPALSRLHLSSAQPSSTADLVHDWREAGIITKTKDGSECIKGENDTFLLEQLGTWNMHSITEAVENVVPQAVKDVLPAALAPTSSDQNKENRKPQADDSSDATRAPDSDAEPLHLVPHDSGHPENKETPYFHHAAFFSNLQTYQPSNDPNDTWGSRLLYGEVVTSTNTLLEKNPTLLSHLPTGFTATATTQIAGRGRGSNVWVSPHGSLMFSTVIRHSISLSTTAPVVFIQYLAALAIVEGVHNYAPGYSKIPMKLKWPNDIYALDPSKTSTASSPKGPEAYIKIGGILVNSSYSPGKGDYTLVVGIGLNVNNASPSTSLSHLARTLSLPAFKLEKLLASILPRFSTLYAHFCQTGWSPHLQNLYYACWLHGDQIVTLEAEGGARARIKGISSDWGLLVAEELGWQDRPTGKRWELQSDSNSFDFFRGLVKRKV